MKTFVGRGMVVSALLVACALACAPGASARAKCTQVGTPGPDIMRGTTGADVLCGRGGADLLKGGKANDVLAGGPGGDRLQGGGGADLLLGGPGADQLLGGPGRDTLRGGPGANVCSDVSRTCKRGKRRPPAPVPSLSTCSSNCSGGSPFSPPRDTQAPTFASITIEGRGVDIAQGSSSVGFAVSAWDGGAPPGASVVSVVVEIAGPAGPWKSVALQSSSENVFWTADVPVPADTALGTYAVTKVVVTDAAGNTTVVDSAELRASWFDDEFSVYRGPDTEPPRLDGFAFTPTATGTSAGPVTISFAADVSDPLSGIKMVRIGVGFPNHAPPYDYGANLGARVVSGTQTGGRRLAEYELPQWAFPGVYRITQVGLEDFAGNWIRLEPPQLESRGFPVQFEVLPPGDTAAPEILGLSLDRTTIPAEGGTILTFLHVRDDLSGIGLWPSKFNSDVRVNYSWPPHVGPTATTGVGPELISGDERDGVWRLTTTFPAWAPAGTYELEYAGANDRAANELLLRPADLEARGWNLSFTKLP